MFYAFLAIFYLIFAVFAWRRLPLAALFVIAALPSYLIRFTVGPVPMTVLEGMILILATVWIARKFLISNSQFPMKFPTLGIPLLLFISAATVAMFVAPDLRAAAGILKAYFVEPILFFLVLIDLLRNNNVILNGAGRSEESHSMKYGTGSFPFARLRVRMTAQNIISALSITALLLSLYAIYQRFPGFGIPPPWDAELRVTSIFPYPNALGLFLAPLVPLFISRFQVSGFRFQKFQLANCYWLLVVISSMLVIVFAKSTGALVGVAAGLFLMIAIWTVRPITHDREQSAARKFCILHLPHTSRQGGMVRGSIFCILIIGVVIGTIYTFPKIKNELLLRDWSGHVRRTQWTETIEMFKDTSTPLGAGRPILGAGLAGYKEALLPYHKATYLEIFEYPHNIVLNFWSETGLPGLLAFIWLIIVFYKNVFQQAHATRYTLHVTAIAAAMLVILVHGLVDVPYFKNDLAILFWIVYALGVSNNETIEKSGRVVEGASLIP